MKYSIAQKIVGLIRLCRPYYCIPMVWPFVLTVWFARGGEMAGQFWPCTAAAIALGMVIAGGYAMNDYCDLRGDTLEGRKSPLTLGVLSARTVIVFSLLLFCGGVGISFLAGRGLFTFALVAVGFVLIFYNLRSKHMSWLKQPMVAILMTSMYPLAIAYSGRPVGSRAWTLIFFATWMLLTSWAYEILKDLRDRKTDRKLLTHPTPLQRHPLYWLIMADWMILISLCLLVGPALTGCWWIYIAFLPIFAITVHQTVGRRKIKTKIRMIYLQYILLGIAVTADTLIFGF